MAEASGREGTSSSSGGRRRGRWGGDNSGFPFGEGAGALRMEVDDRDPLERLGSL